jgi:hypothetical protein
MQKTEVTHETRLVNCSVDDPVVTAFDMTDQLEALTSAGTVSAWDVLDAASAAPDPNATTDSASSTVTAPAVTIRFVKSRIFLPSGHAEKRHVLPRSRPP